jgi:hypothetical protein
MNQMTGKGKEDRKNERRKIDEDGRTEDGGEERI